jgi:signal transduction histidine kinase
VVYGIVRGHGGTVEVKSQVGHGSLFTLRLPRHPPAGTKKEQS